MFGKSKNKDQYTPSGVMSTIANGMSVNGDIVAEGDLRIDGHILGNIRSNAKLVVGESAIVDGDIEARNVDIFGTVNGNATIAELLCLKSKCVINGNISVGRLDIEANAVFNGKCTMTTTTQHTPPPQQRSQPQPETQTETKQEEQPKKPVVIIGEEGVVAVQQSLL
jgi:cytoskeletal protein CcmA (bactofilin family)